MEAFKLKKAVEKLLEENALGRYAVAGSRRKTGAAEILKTPLVTVHYASGDFDKQKSGANGPYLHGCSFNVVIQAAVRAKAGASALRDPSASPAQLAEALAGAADALMLADEKTDGMISLLYGILMSPENRNLGAGFNAERWVSGVRKSNPEPMGSVITAAAAIQLEAQCFETAPGAECAGGAGAVETSLSRCPAA